MSRFRHFELRCTLTARQGVSVFGEDFTTQETELLNKVKKLLCLVIKCGQDISATARDSVRKNVTSLVLSMDKKILIISLNIVPSIRWDPLLCQSSSNTCS
jgi:hypothetical protein